MMWGRSAAEAIRMADEAKTAAASALGRAEAIGARQESHEAVCAQRQGAIIADLKEIKEFLKRVVWAIVAGSVILAYNTLKAHGVMP